MYTIIGTAGHVLALQLYAAMAAPVDIESLPPSFAGTSNTCSAGWEERSMQ